MKQIVGNACGTVGILHSILNSRESPLNQIRPGSFLESFVSRSSSMTPDERAVLLNEDDVSSS